MRTVTKCLTKIGMSVSKFLDSMPEENQSREAFKGLHSIAAELDALEDEVKDADNEVDVDVIARAQESVNEWGTTEKS